MTDVDPNLVSVVKSIVKSFLPRNVQSVERVDVRPGDVIVFECSAHPSEAIAESIKASAAKVWPDCRIVVVDPGIKLKVLRERDMKTPRSVEAAASMIREAVHAAAEDGRADGIEDILEALIDKAMEDAS